MDKIQVGIVGCGSIFPMHAYSLEHIKGTEIVAVCDTIEERAKQKAREFGCDFFTDYHQMISNKKLDCVHILTPHYLHCEMAVSALMRGVNVICEKPMGIHPEDGDRMVEAAKKSGAKLGIIFQNRYNAGSVLAKEELLSGSLGRVLGGKVVVAWERTEEYYAQDAWRGTLDQEGGGVIINQAIHSLDLARWLVGDEVAKVDATVNNYCHPSIEVEDQSSGVITFQNGVRICYFATNNLSFSDEVEITIHCEKGIIKIKGPDAVIKYFDGSPEKKSVKMKHDIDFGDDAKNVWGIGHYNQLSAWYHALQKGEEDDSAEEGLKTHRMIMKIYQASRGEQ